MVNSQKELEKEKAVVFGENYIEDSLRGPVKDIPYLKSEAYALKRTFDPRRSLDIGCAKGYLVKYLQQMGVEAHGIDISRYALENSPKEVSERLKLVDVECDRIPFPDEYFDLVTAFSVIEHLNSVENAIKQARRILSEGGFLLETTPGPRSKHATADPTHVNIKELKEWLSIHRKHGFITVNRMLAAKYKFYLTYAAVRFFKGKSKIPFLNKMGKLGNLIRLSGAFPFWFIHSYEYRGEYCLIFRKKNR